MFKNLAPSRLVHLILPQDLYIECRVKGVILKHTLGWVRIYYNILNCAWVPCVPALDRVHDLRWGDCRATCLKIHAWALKQVTLARLTSSKWSIECRCVASWSVSTCFLRVNTVWSCTVNDVNSTRIAIIHMIDFRLICLVTNMSDLGSGPPLEKHWV